MLLPPLKMREKLPPTSQYPSGQPMYAPVIGTTA
jgi:hypothetical protein